VLPFGLLQTAQSLTRCILSVRESHHAEHHGVIEAFIAYANHMGKEVVIKAETEATLDDMQGVDCVVALGGDHTFLRASSLIWDRAIPILGINTNQQVYNGALNPHFIDFDQRERHSQLLLETMEDDHSVAFEKRARLIFERLRQHEKQTEERVLVLNEAFC
jgi:NAD kinase